MMTGIPLDLLPAARAALLPGHRSNRVHVGLAKCLGKGTTGVIFDATFEEEQFGSQHGA